MVALLLGLFALVSAVDVAPPIIPTEYTTVIEASMPYINFKMPMRVATGLAAQKITYYGGLEVDISEARGNYKYAYNNSHRVCLYTSPEIGPAQGGGVQGGGVQGAPVNDLGISMLAFFPDFSHYSFVGNELIGGILCQRFDTNHRRGTTGMMDDHISFYWDPLLNKPIRWHLHSREKTFDAHTDEYFFDYVDFQAGPPSEPDLALPTDCHVDPISPPGANGRMVSAAQGFLAAAHGLRVPTTEEASHLLWTTFAQEYSKTYGSQEERELRHTIFDRNVRTIRDLGLRHAPTASFRGGYYLDMTHAEMMRGRGGHPGNHGVSRENRRSAAQRAMVRSHKRTLEAEDLPQNFDWRVERPGSVSPVKDQGWCGSCWTFGLMEPIESIQAIKTGQMTILPEQFVIDCLWDAFNFSGGLAQDGNAGCGGGYSDHGAMEIVEKYGGVVPTAEAYGAYLNVDGYCKDTRLMATGATVTGWVDIASGDELELMDALVTQGPISIGLAFPAAADYYDGGVLNITECKCNMNEIDHQVVLVGYGTEESSGLNYYLLRNSWSTYWGDEGYFKVTRGELDCCISFEAGYPEIAAVAAGAVVEAAEVPDPDLVVVFA